MCVCGLNLHFYYFGVNAQNVRACIRARVQECGQVAVKIEEGGILITKRHLRRSLESLDVQKIHICQNFFVRTIGILAENCCGIVTKNAS